MERKSRAGSAFPETSGFVWKHKIFGDGRPRAPWDFVSREDEEFLRFDLIEVWRSIRESERNGETTTAEVRLIHTRKVGLLCDEAYVVLARRWTEFLEMDKIFQAYGKGEGCRLPFSNPLGAPIAAIKKVMEPPEVDRIGMAFIAKTGRYYRVRVIRSFGIGAGVDASDDVTCRVLLMDYGYIENVERKHVFYLPHRFAQVPFAAIRLMLRNGEGAFYNTSLSLIGNFNTRNDVKEAYMRLYPILRGKIMEMIKKHTKDRVFSIRLASNNAVGGQFGEVVGKLLLPLESIKREIFFEDDNPESMAILEGLIGCLELWFS